MATVPDARILVSLPISCRADTRCRGVRLGHNMLGLTSSTK
jgi:hypothetical protein